MRRNKRIVCPLWIFSLMLNSVVCFADNIESRVVLAFRPLGATECLMGGMRRDDQSSTFHLYAIDSKNQREIGEWRNVDFWAGALGGVDGVEFSIDRRFCFFAKYDSSSSSTYRSIYFVNGPAGKVVCIIHNTKSLFRTTPNGQYIVFEDGTYNTQSKNSKRFVIYDVWNSKKLRNIDWEIDDENGEDIFYFRRWVNPASINIILASDEFRILAIGKIDLENLSFKGELLRKNETGKFSNLQDEVWHDDIINQYKDQTLLINNFK